MINAIEPKFFMLNCKFIAPGFSYEDYLMEILNVSPFFRSKSRDYSEYTAPKTQSNGESDAYATGYELDFKLLINEEVMCGLSKNRPTVNKDYIKQGIIIVNDNKNPTPIPQKNVLCDIMDITEDRIKNRTFLSKTAENFVRNLEKDKNLFLYYPYEYNSDSAYAITSIANMFTRLFKDSLCYRGQQRPNKDTFICFKVNEWFYIFEWVEDTFVYRDKVNELLCPAYKDYKLYSFF